MRNNKTYNFRSFAEIFPAHKANITQTTNFQSTQSSMKQSSLPPKPFQITSILYSPNMHCPKRQNTCNTNIKLTKSLSHSFSNPKLSLLKPQPPSSSRNRNHNQFHILSSYITFINTYRQHSLHNDLTASTQKLHEHTSNITHLRRCLSHSHIIHRKHLKTMHTNIANLSKATTSLKRRIRHITASTCCINKQFPQLKSSIHGIQRSIAALTAETSAYAA